MHFCFPLFYKIVKEFLTGCIAAYWTMAHFYRFCCILCVMLNLPFSASIEPISSAVGAVSAVVMSAVYAGYQYTKCQRNECCDNKWIKLNTLGLKDSLKHSLHGQHLVERIVTRAITAHVRQKSPQKALVIAFHGGTGSGKNHVSKIIAEHLYTNGMKSQFVHLYIANQHFSGSNIQQYQQNLKDDITKFTKICSQNLFIFDELDKMPPGILDVLTPFVDYHEEVDGVDYRHNIFIFLSNAGGKDIMNIAFKFWMADKIREEIRMKDIESTVNLGAFNEKGGLQYSAIVKRALIDHYVPFLPLEKRHVKLCIQDVLRSRSIPLAGETIDEIADELEYHPPEFKIFSKSGCKKVSQKVDIYALYESD